jgi:uncharacterized membrane protein
MRPVSDIPTPEQCAAAPSPTLGRGSRLVRDNNDAGIGPPQRGTRDLDPYVASSSRLPRLYQFQTPMPTDPLELPATPSRVRDIGRRAALPLPVVRRALALATATPDEEEWRRFLSRVLALLGAGLILAGTVCFVAYNWTRFGRFAKFGLLELAIMAAAAIAWRTLPRLSGQVALAGAAVLVGPLLALYGQTYETGADPYGLFLAWLALIVPWVIAARFSPLWLLALGLLDMSVVLYGTQVVATNVDADALFLAVSAIHALALVAWEVQRRLTDRRSPHLIAVVAFGALLVPAAIRVVEDSPGPVATLGLAGLAAAIAAVMHYYRRVRPDRFMVTIAVATGLAWMAAGIGRIVFRELDLEVGGLFIMSIVVLGEIALGLRWYRGSSSPAKES